jgi:hypothetical protein
MLIGGPSLFVIVEFLRKTFAQGDGQAGDQHLLLLLLVVRLDL